MLAVVHTVAEVRAALEGRPSVGLAPTMGALHQGHGSLIDLARRDCECVVVSLFVNPLQFDRAADLDGYPRTLEADAAFCRARGADVLFAPTAARPLRAKRLPLAAATQVQPHAHPWAQLAFSATGVMRLTAGRGTYLVPPSRAVWIPAGVEHVVDEVEDCELRTLYLHQAPGRCGPLAAGTCGESKRGDDAMWRRCRVLEVSDLLRQPLLALPTAADGDGAPPEAAEKGENRQQ